MGARFATLLPASEMEKPTGFRLRVSNIYNAIFVYFVYNFVCRLKLFAK